MSKFTIVAFKHHTAKSVFYKTASDEQELTRYLIQSLITANADIISIRRVK